MEWNPISNYSLKGHGYIKGRALNALACLSEWDARGQPWVEMDIHPLTWRWLAERDLIVRSIGKDGHPDAYKITLRGKQTLNLFAAHRRRVDGICPSCKTRPKAPKGDYCSECRRAQLKAGYQRRKLRIIQRALGGGDEPR